MENSNEQESIIGVMRIAEPRDADRPAEDAPMEEEGTAAMDIVGNVVLCNLEDEISMLIETGKALGFDFGVNEVKLRDELRREERWKRLRGSRRWTTEWPCVVCAWVFCSFPMFIMSWNVRGLGMVEKKRVVKGLVNNYKPTIFIL